MCWKWEWKAATKTKPEKWDKPPKTLSGQNTDATNPANWSTYAQCLAAWRNGTVDGIGISLRHVAGLEPRLGAFDVDNCRDPNTGTLALYAQNLLEICGSYAEITPSGTGIRIIGLSKAGASLHKKYAVGDGVSVEIYRDAKRYITVTGLALNGYDVPLAGLDAVIDQVHAACEAAKKTKKTAGASGTKKTKKIVLSKKLTALLIIDNRGQGLEHGKYATRSDLLFAFLTGCSRAGVVAKQTAHDACLDATYVGKAIYQHCLENGGSAYVLRQVERAWEAVGITIDDFHSYMPRHLYIFAPVGELWPASSVNARVPAMAVLKKDGTPVIDPVTKRPKTIRPSAWLDRNRAVEQMTWAPGMAAVVNDRLIAEGGWFERKSCNVFNLYKPPLSIPARTEAPTIWLEHVRLIYPNDAGHIVPWLAQRAQHPEDKINHALVLGGYQGIGKDTLLEPVKRAVGAWNFVEVSPKQVFGRFNGHLKAVVLRVSEARDLGEYDRFAFYDHMKVITAAPPDVLRVDEKNLREHSILNVVGVVITTNHKADGIYLPPDDRRHYVAWSDFEKSQFDKAYWNRIWQWYADGGLDIVANYLLNFNLSGFDPKAPPPQTEAFWEIVNASRPPEDAEMADALDALAEHFKRDELKKMGFTLEQANKMIETVRPAWPDVVTTAQIRLASAVSEFNAYLGDRRNSRKIPYRFEACGYTAVRNPQAKDGQWVIDGHRQAVYARVELSLQQRVIAVKKAYAVR